MITSRRAAATVAAIVAMATTASAQLVVVGGHWWKPEIGGTVRVDGGALTGTEVDLDDTLGLDLEPDVIGIEGALRLGGWVRVDAMLEQFDLSGSAEVDESFSFDGEVFSVSERITSKLEVTRLRGTIELSPFALVPGVDGGIYGGAEYLRAEASVRSDRIGEVGGEIDTVLPLVGARVRGYLLEGLYVEGAGELSTFDLGDVSLDYVQLRAAIGYEITFFAGVEIGYRIEELEGGADDVSASVDFEGPYAAIFAQF